MNDRLIFQVCFDDSPGALAVLDPDGKIIRVNKAFQALFGKVLATHYHFDAVLSHLQFRFVPAPSLSEIWLQEGRFHFLLTDAKTGHQLGCRISAYKDLNVLVVAVDEVVEPGFYNNALNEVVGRLNSLLNCTSVFICRISLDGRYTYANQSFLKHFGHTWESLSELPVMKSVHPDDIDAVVATTARLMENPGVRTRCRIRKPNAAGTQYIDTAWEFTAITNAAGVVVEIQCVGTDVSHTVAQENQIQEYLRRLRGYSFSISHELRRPLTNVQALLSLLPEAYDEHDETKLLELLRISINEIDAISRSLSNTVSMQDNFNPQDLSPADSLQLG